ncbi:hypothetical protein BKI52_15835 [marine bacterium AO1-C]|nr:hypothetical protein BKI52_15835 [marine bacterium AO1-C]
MSNLNTKSKIHVRMRNFVDWIAPDPDKRDAVEQHRKGVKEKVSAKAEEDRLIIKSMPKAGSFAKKTGLRRYKRGDAEQEGQDIDQPFVVEPTDSEGNKVEGSKLLDKFDNYVGSAYPDSEKERTKRSIKLKFSSAIYFDIVPMLATKNDEEQVIIQSNGDEVTSSVQKHNSFTRDRTDDSNQVKGRVKFNECVRILKWWNSHHTSQSAVFSLTDNTKKEVPSFVINLLAAKAYDEIDVCETYPETLFKWFGKLASLVRNSRPIFFNDYTKNLKEKDLDDTILWSVIDPVTSDNVVTRKWDGAEIDELAQWLEESRDAMARAIRYDGDGEDAKSLEWLVKIFGNSFKNHCD